MISWLAVTLWQGQTLDTKGGAFYSWQLCRGYRDVTDVACVLTSVHSSWKVKIFQFLHGPSVSSNFTETLRRSRSVFNGAQSITWSPQDVPHCVPFIVQGSTAQRSCISDFNTCKVKDYFKENSVLLFLMSVTQTFLAIQNFYSAAIEDHRLVRGYECKSHSSLWMLGTTSLGGSQVCSRPRLMKE